MNCNEVRERLPLYWDLPNGDPQRIAVDAHVKECPSCKEEFDFWEKSEQLIGIELEDIPLDLSVRSTVSGNVMSRIYKDESWRLPVAKRMYVMSDKMRRNLMLCIAFCLALFIGSFIYAIFGSTPSAASALQDESLYTIQTPQKLVASDKAVSTPSGYVQAKTISSVKQTFIDPIPFQMGPIHSYSNFLLIISILGFIGTMFVMNWVSRVKA